MDGERVERTEIAPSFLIHGTPLYNIPYIFKEKKIFPSLQGCVYAIDENLYFNYCKMYSGLDGAIIKFNTQNCIVKANEKVNYVTKREYEIIPYVSLEDFEEVYFYIDGIKIITWDKTKILEKELLFNKDYSFDWLNGMNLDNRFSKRRLSRQEIFRLYVDFVV